MQSCFSIKLNCKTNKSRFFCNDQLVSNLSTTKRIYPDLTIVDSFISRLVKTVRESFECSNNKSKIFYCKKNFNIIVVSIMSHISFNCKYVCLMVFARS